MNFIIAGTYEEYRDWLSKNGNNAKENVYVYDASTLRGRTEIHGRFIGSYSKRKDLGILLALIRTTNRIPAPQEILPLHVMKEINDS